MPTILCLGRVCPSKYQNKIAKANEHIKMRKLRILIHVINNINNTKFVICSIYPTVLIVQQS